MPPASGAVPLWTPPVDTRSRCHCEPQRSNLGRCAGHLGRGPVGRHILHASCQRGCAPLDSSCRHPLALSLRAAAKQSGEVRGTWGGGGREAHPPDLLPKERCPSGLLLSTPARAVIASRSEAIWGGAGHLGRGRSGGTSSMPPAKGAVPLWTPPVDTRSRCHCEPQRSNLGRCGAPGEGAVGRHILHASCQRGGAPLDSSCRHPLALSLRAAAKQSGEVRGTWGGSGREAPLTTNHKGHSKKDSSP